MRTFLAFVICFMAAEGAAAAQQQYGIPSTHSSSYGAVNLPVSTVAQLPVCNALHVGILRAVSDANAPAFGATLAGGGAVGALAYCNGANWTAR